MSAYRAQVHLDAPVDDVWALVANPSTYPEWWPVVVEIRVSVRSWRRMRRGVEDSGRGSSTAGSSTIVKFKELRWHCPTTGGYGRWRLADAQGGTFVDMEMGIKDPESCGFALFDRRSGAGSSSAARSAIDGLRGTLSLTQSSSCSSAVACVGDGLLAGIERRRATASR